MTRSLREPDIFAVASQLTDILDSLNVPYVIGGSIASIVHGTIRSTMDIDMVTDLKLEQVESFVTSLKDEFYIDETAARRAIGEHSNFNLIHLDTMFKVDIFIPKTRPFDEQQLSRRIAVNIRPDSDNTIWVLSAEDIILAKLEWFSLGEETSERQWLDILGVMRNQQSDLDLGYLKESAQSLGVGELLERAMREMGVGR